MQDRKFLGKLGGKTVGSSITMPQSVSIINIPNPFPDKTVKQWFFKKVLEESGSNALKFAIDKVENNQVNSQNKKNSNSVNENTSYQNINTKK